MDVIAAAKENIRLKQLLGESIYCVQPILIY